jgi:proteic killer suppression protein
MILGFRHRGPRRLYRVDDRRGLNAEHVPRITTILARLDVATQPEDMDVAGLRLRALKGDLVGFWNVTVRANWRNIFRFEDGNAIDVDYLDYH